MSKFWASASSSSSSSSKSSSVSQSSSSSDDQFDLGSSAKDGDLEEQSLSAFAGFEAMNVKEDHKLAPPHHEDKQEHNDDEDGIPLEPSAAWEHIQSKQTFLPVPTTSAKNKKSDNVLRIVCISDTHSFHRRVPIPTDAGVDLLIHAGDFTKSGETGTVEDLAQYFAEHCPPYRSERIVCIAGNHELTFQPEEYRRVYAKRFHRGLKMPFDAERARAALLQPLENSNNDPSEHSKKSKPVCTYLQDETYTLEIPLHEKTPHNEEGKTKTVEIHGTPWTPTFYNWAFNLDRGPPIRMQWEKIPTSTDILITHGPPLGRCDITGGNAIHGGHRRTGCLDLLHEIQNRIQPRVNIFGHIHGSHGASFDGTTLYVNASCCTDDRDADPASPLQPCIVVDLPLCESAEDEGTSLPSACIVEPYCEMTEGEVVKWLKDKTPSYDALLPYFVNEARSDSITGSDFIETKRFLELADQLLLHRDGVARLQLSDAMMRLRAESY